MKDPIQTIGSILKGDEQRDCIHVAIMPAIAAEDVRCGEEVGLVYGTTNQIKHMEGGYGLKPIGIVDPFLRNVLGEAKFHGGTVKKGQRCWVFLFPGSVSGMRHHWSHPAIDNPHVPKGESEDWLRRFADKWNFDYIEMIEAASGEKGGYVVARGIDLHGADELEPGDEGLFWQHLEAITGKHFDAEHRADFGWSCAC